MNAPREENFVMTSPIALTLMGRMSVSVNLATAAMESPVKVITFIFILEQ